VAAGIDTLGTSRAAKTLPAYNATAKEKVYAFLESKPSGADALQAESNTRSGGFGS
jgi:hypothetical protein